MLLEDGTGKGFSAKVSADNRLHTFALLEYPIEAFSHKGDAYTIASDFIALTNIATYSGVLYIAESATDRVIHIERIRTSSSSPTLWKMVKNPTAGTLITGGTANPPANMNFASGKTAAVTSLKGTAGAGLTVTDGTLYGQWRTGVDGVYQDTFQGSIILAAGNSLALVCLPSVNPTTIAATMTIWEEAN